MMRELLADESEYCHNCPLLSRQFVGGVCEYTTCPCLIVGTAPGEAEEKTLIPFSGPAGMLLREVIDGYGVEAYLTNVLKRRPTTVDGIDRKPTKNDCWKCGSHLVEELIRNQASVVLALGQTATSFFLGAQARVSQLHGLSLRITKFQHDLYVIPAYDPAYVLRQGGLNSKVGDTFLGAVEEIVQVKVRKGI